MNYLKHLIEFEVSEILKFEIKSHHYDYLYTHTHTHTNKNYIFKIIVRNLSKFGRINLIKQITYFYHSYHFFHIGKLLLKYYAYAIHGLIKNHV